VPNFIPIGFEMTNHLGFLKQSLQQGKNKQKNNNKMLASVPDPKIKIRQEYLLFKHE